MANRGQGCEFFPQIRRLDTAIICESAAEEGES